MKDNVDQTAGFGLLRLASRTADLAGALYAQPSYVWDAALAAKQGPVYLYRDLGKRVLDVIFVLLTLPFSLSIILFCAIALWIDGGNPFYTQQRLGEGGKRFSILKLRTMVRDADQVLETCVDAPGFAW